MQYYAWALAAAAAVSCQVSLLTVRRQAVEVAAGANGTI
eukprot:SAG11_NODE_32072_length_286_cov_1.513369_1_plen_38_part_10